MGRIPASCSGNRLARTLIEKVAMAYNKKFKPVKPKLKTPTTRKGKKQNVSVCWRDRDGELKERFEAACKSSELSESEMLRQMMTYSLERMAA